MNMEDVRVFAGNLKTLLERNLKEQRKMELEALKSSAEVISSDEVDERIKEIGINYKQQIFKLGKIRGLIDSNDVSALQQIKAVHELTIASDVKQARKDASVTTLIALSEKKTLNIGSLTKEEAYLLCNTMINAPIEEYDTFDRVLSTPSILDAAMGKTDIFTEQMDILYEVADYCAENVDVSTIDEEYPIALRDSLKIISRYTIADKKEQGKNMK